MVKDTSTVLMPFAKDAKTGLSVGIDEVPNGLACNCVCISCGMQVKARQGNKQRIAHFAHHKKAKTECKISYWVSIRSIAEQILEQITFIHIPSIAKTTFIKVKSVDKGYSEEHQFTFDLKLNTSIGTIFVYFITGEGSVEGRSKFYLEQLPQYFSNSLILEIDIKSIRENHSQAKAHLFELLIYKTLNKYFLTTQKTYYKNLSKTTSITTVPTSFKQPTIQLNDYSDFIRDILGYKDLSIFDSEDLQVCSQMLSFYHDRSGNLKWRNLQKYHVGIQAQVLCVARIRTDYFIYNVNEIGKINIIKKVGSQFIVDQFIKGRNVPDIKQPSRKVSSLDESKMLRAWAVMKKERRTYIEKYTIVSQSWNIKIACCKSNYFGFLKHNEEWLVFEVVNNEVKVITHILKEEGIQSYIEALAEKANDVF